MERIPMNSKGCLSLIVSLLCVHGCFGQGKNATSQGPNTGGGGASLSGVVFLASNLPQVYIAAAPADATTPATPEIRNLSPKRKQFVLCFLLRAVGSSATQPFVLEPRPRPVPSVPAPAIEPLTAALDRVCNVPDDSHPLVSGSTLVVAVDARQVLPASRRSIQAVALNVATTAGTAVTPAPVRNSMAPGSAAAAGGEAPTTVPDAFFIAWPVNLSGDTIPTVTMSALYRPPDSLQTTTTSPPPTGAPPSAPPTGTPPLIGASSTAQVVTRATPYQDQVISLLTLPLPQVHPLYYYNVATGVVVSSLRNPTFTRGLTGPTPPGGTAQYTTLTDNGNVQIAPVLFFTGYFVPFDAERNWNIRDLIPGGSFGFSLSSPATSFYFGGSVEVRRNVQLVGGLNLAKVTSLANAGYIDPTSSAAPVTKQQFGKGAFVGLTLNIDFIKGLFGGGGGGGGSPKTTGN